MGTRAVALSFLIVSGLVAWITITVPFAARVLQLLIAVSMAYVAWLAWEGRGSCALRWPTVEAARPSPPAVRRHCRSFRWSFPRATRRP